jgi:hypothetical protein
LRNKVNAENFISDEVHLEWFTQLDDTDILSALKCWMDHEDFILSTLCKKIVRRDLFRTELRSVDFDVQELAYYKERAKDYFGLNDEEVEYFIYYQAIQNSAYSADKEPICIVNNKGQLIDIAEASDLSNLEALSQKVVKYALTYPKELGFVELGLNSKN